MEKLHFYELIVLCNLLLQLPSLFAYSKNHENPANELVDIINNNRTAQKLPHLQNTPGLGCLALQFIKTCKSNCSTITHCHPQEDDFIEIFAPNCGLELPTFAAISGYITGCQSKYIKPSEAFSHVLIKDKHSLSIMSNVTYTEAGVGLIGDRKRPFFWCVLFSNGLANSTFVLENRGEGIKQQKGCFSGADVQCSEGQTTNVFGDNTLVLSCLFIYIYFNFFATV